MRVALLSLSFFVVAVAFVGALAFAIEILGHLQEGANP